MTYHDFFSDVAMPIACLIAAGVVVHRHKRIFQNKQPGDSLEQHLRRAQADQILDRKAQRQTALPALLNAALLCGTAWLLRFDFGWLALTYLAVGLFVSKSSEYTPRREDDSRLSWLDRQTLRVFFAWFWPVNILRNRRRD